MPIVSHFEHSFQDESPIFSMDDFEGNFTGLAFCIPARTRKSETDCPVCNECLKRC